MNKWAIFSDVDGTIYPFPDKTLSTNTINKTKELSLKNIPFVINTGNGPFNKIQRLCDQLSSRYIVCSNGALIFDNLTKEILHVEYMPVAEVEKVFQVAKETNVGLYYFGTHQYYLHLYTQEFKEFISEFCEYNDWITDGSIPNDVHKVEIYGPRENLVNFYNLAKERNIDLNICDVKSHIEITKSNVSKGTGAKWLCDNVFEMNIKDAMTVGDSQNDISMFELSDYAYVMDNADNHTKGYAKFFTSDVKQDGLVEAIDDYLYRSDFELKRMVSQGKKKISR
ncbi:HAD-IIB family hydrolase [Mycoplasma sp. NEAQ87857]|nr:HAD family hydrolase [Mycoplasma sp. NEAQ87857]QGZ97633.1 HAD-IIB family hydrolase [Mycoplasma sp. NEAQ87857]